MDGLELWRVDVVEVRGFVVEVCPRLGRRAAQLTVVALRSLLRFLHLEGELERSLVGAVPSVAGWRLSGLPKRLERDQVDALLESCDRSTVIGIRDLAILTVLARLGLRAGEVAGLSGLSEPSKLNRRGSLADSRRWVTGIERSVVVSSGADARACALSASIVRSTTDGEDVDVGR